MVCLGLPVSSERAEGKTYTYDLSVERYNVEEEGEGRYIVGIYTSTHGDVRRSINPSL